MHQPGHDPTELTAVRPLAGVRVLDAAEGVAGPYAARLLGDLGAEVVKVEPPAGDTTRTFGPFRDGVPHPERSGLFAYLNAGKRGTILDPRGPGDRATALELAASVDILIDGGASGDDGGENWLDPAALRACQPALVHVSVTPFGRLGPRASWRGNDLIAFHSSGFAFGFPALQVDAPELAPLNAPTYAAEFLAGQVGAAAALHGLFGARLTGQGCALDVSLQEAVAAANNAQFNRVGAAAEGAIRRTFSAQPTNSVVALLPCLDGWVAISPREEHQWLRWLEVMGSPAWAADPRFADRTLRDRHWGTLYPLLAEWTRTQTRAALSEAAQSRRVACLPLGTATDLLASAQLAARGFFVELEDDELGGRLPLPGRPYQLRQDAAPPTATPTVPAPATIGRAPRLGEYPALALGGPSRVSAAIKPQPGPMLRPLAGVRVVDFSWVLTGPICTRYLAALGADVIKVESASRPDLSQRNLMWEELNPGKRSITLNLKHERARELARALIDRSDVVVENFSTGVMDRLGLDYPRLRERNSRVIMATSSASGRTGPERDQIAYGTLIQCLTGWATLSAHPGRPPRSAGGVWTDPLTASFETLLVLAALWRQQRDGVGCLIDLSMAETTIAALPEPVLAWSLAHEVLEPRGNRHPRYAPQGCYPATGDDQWVALSVQSDAAWPVLCDLMQRPDLRADPTLATAAGRQAQHDALDTAIAAWTRARSGADTAAILQAHGIAATATLTPSDVASDPQLQARSFVSQIEQSDGQGTFTSPGVPWLIDGQRLHSQRRAPTLGEDNDAVFTSLLGLDEQTYAELIRTEIIY